MKAETTASGASVAESVEPRAEAHAELRLMRSLLIGIFILMTTAALYFARAFFMPVILAFLLALTLTPIVRFLRKHGVPDVLSATLLVLLSVFLVASAGYLLSGPVIDLINNSSSIGLQLTDRLAPFKQPLERVMDISHQLEALTETAQEPNVQKVAVAPSGMLSTAASNIVGAGTSITIVFVLSLFLLASGTLFYEKIVQSFASLSDKKR
ncbi:MAG: AI-2E family transporter, partial [Mesorhizobium sp.]